MEVDTQWGTGGAVSISVSSCAPASLTAGASISSAYLDRHHHSTALRENIQQLVNGLACNQECSWW